MTGWAGSADLSMFSSAMECQRKKLGRLEKSFFTRDGVSAALSSIPSPRRSNHRLVPTKDSPMHGTQP